MSENGESNNNYLDLVSTRVDLSIPWQAYGHTDALASEPQHPALFWMCVQRALTHCIDDPEAVAAEGCGR
jgi:hypothetical protein